MPIPAPNRQGAPLSHQTKLKRGEGVPARSSTGASPYQRWPSGRAVAQAGQLDPGGIQAQQGVGRVGLAALPEHGRVIAQGRRDQLDTYWQRALAGYAEAAEAPVGEG